MCDMVWVLLSQIMLFMSFVLVTFCSLGFSTISGGLVE